VPNKFSGQLKEALLSAFNGAHPDGLASWVLQESKLTPRRAWRFGAAHPRLVGRHSGRHSYRSSCRWNRGL